ncbi:hypothetical protein [Macrococcus bovicus]|uniref:Uncharacterized protein n=1 Tax=Macrococcus bovicus TaxID=69968 RepID=A0A4R6BZY8_9STAP|nr:hypothetical protein [Macrococcus bovicus]TDM14314.1 hypothetical protein ERX55_05065 [Macrococcus bovicus]
MDKRGIGMLTEAQKMFRLNEVNRVIAAEVQLCADDYLDPDFVIAFQNMPDQDHEFFHDELENFSYLLDTYAGSDMAEHIGQGQQYILNTAEATTIYQQLVLGESEMNYDFIILESRRSDGVFHTLAIYRPKEQRLSIVKDSSYYQHLSEVYATGNKTFTIETISHMIGWEMVRRDIDLNIPLTYMPALQLEGTSKEMPRKQLAERIYQHLHSEAVVVKVMGEELLTVFVIKERAFDE